jgi:hypothetical protein
VDQAESMTESPAPKGNRRLAARRTCHLTALYQVKDQWHPATAMDLSRRGCRLRIGEHLQRGTKLKVRLECSQTDAEAQRRIETPGRVVWSRLEGLSYQCGVDFVVECDEVDQMFA